MKNWERYRQYLDTGDFHVHTDYTEGSGSVREMCEQAMQNGLRLICFAEHVRREISYDYGSLVSDVLDARELFPKLVILHGCEAKVCDRSGSLDVSPGVLALSEMVVASFHGFPHASKEDFLKALFGMLKNPSVDIWGHPATFLRNVELTAGDTRRIIGECKKRKVLVEDSLVEAYQAPDFIKACRKLGATVVTNSDAHCREDLKRV